MDKTLDGLACFVPEYVHPVCLESLKRFIAGDSSVHAAAFACNMVDSRLIPLVECLLNTYADGILLKPVGL